MSPQAARLVIAPATILSDVPPDARASTEETFGPIAPVVGIGSLEEAIELTNASPYGLLSAIFTRDLARGLRFADSVRTGWVNVNESSNYWESHLPFGGRAGSDSGLGRVGGSHVMDAFTELQTVDSRESFGSNGLPLQATLDLNPGGITADIEVRGNAPVLLRAGDGRASQFPRAWVSVSTADRMQIRAMVIAALSGTSAPFHVNGINMSPQARRRLRTPSAFGDERKIVEQCRTVRLRALDGEQTQLADYAARR